MTTSKLFLNNTTQAVRLPKDVAFPTDVQEVEILVQGDARILVPKGQSLRWILEHGPGLSDDFSIDSVLSEPVERDVQWPN